MKTLTNLMKIASAALLVSGAAMAQSMTANVPFDFQFGDTHLPAGQYRVDTSRGLSSGLIVVQNGETKQAAMRIGIHEQSAGLEPNRPKLVFSCGDSSGCVLHKVSTSSDEYVYSAPKAKGQYSASIPMTPSRAD